MDANARVLFNLFIRRIASSHEAFGNYRHRRQGQQTQVCLHQIFAQQPQIHLNIARDERNEDAGDREPLVSENTTIIISCTILFSLMCFFFLFRNFILYN